MNENEVNHVLSIPLPPRDYPRDFLSGLVGNGCLLTRATAPFGVRPRLVRLAFLKTNGLLSKMGLRELEVCDLVL